MATVHRVLATALCGLFATFMFSACGSATRPGPSYAPRPTDPAFNTTGKWAVGTSVSLFYGDSDNTYVKCTLKAFQAGVAASDAAPPGSQYDAVELSLTNVAPAGTKAKVDVVGGSSMIGRSGNSYASVAGPSVAGKTMLKKGMLAIPPGGSLDGWILFNVSKSEGMSKYRFAPFGTNTTQMLWNILPMAAGVTPQSGP